MLFLELALIRWLGANVLYLGYFSNLILLGSFLGIGLGFLIDRPGRGYGDDYSPWLVDGTIGELRRVRAAAVTPTGIRAA